jgi:hypothetical protein
MFPEACQFTTALASSISSLTTAFVRIYLNMLVSRVPPDVVCLTFLASAHLCRGTESSEVWAPISKIMLPQQYGDRGPTA